MNTPLLNTYRTLVILGYIIVVPILVYWLHIPLVFSVSLHHVWYLLVTLCVSVVVAVLVHTKMTQQRIQLRGISVTSFMVLCCYALAFAIPEEILFRVIVQSVAMSYVGDFLAIFLSSLVYGLAHLPNGAKGIQPRYWNWQFALVTFFLGLPLGWLYYITGSITLPVVLHALYIILYKIVRV